MTLKISMTALALTFCATTLSAQATTAQSTVVGPSGNTVYPVEVIGANGVSYFCETGTSVVNSQVVRLCQRSTSIGTTGGTTAGVTGGGTGLGGLGTIGSVGAALGAAAVIGAITSGGSTSSTN